jgi:hypothetical protein
MTCDNFDLKGYLLGEVDPAEKHRIAGHLAACETCHEEMDRLSLTNMALGSLRDEEPPRRIAFVSDKVFEPRWWQRLQAPSLAFGSALVLAAAILAHGALTRPTSTATAPNIDTAAIEQRLERKFDDRLAKTVSAVQAQDRKDTALALASVEAKFSDQRRADLIAAEMNFENLYKRTTLNVKMAMTTPQQDGGASPGVNQ